MVIDTNVANIVNSVDELNKASEQSDGSVARLASSSFSNALQAFASGGFAQWASGQ
ncbi:uncharacterized protein ZBAI_04511 [Zygosaccharomyces bailii ISA1307]|nr:uncharacterized protein ZBAI_04511 [Zygosaccharomyces bailii ISA1307]